MIKVWRFVFEWILKKDPGSEVCIGRDLVRESRFGGLFRKRSCKSI